MIFDKRVLITALTVILAVSLGHFLVLASLKIANIKIRDERGGVVRWIGYFERALVALFVCLGLTAQTVFIFAVKAAVLGYRLPTDKDEQRNMAEYMLLGTMVSYFFALVIGLCGRLAMGLPLKG